jgi:hypothetical protein
MILTHKKNQGFSSLQDKTSRMKAMGSISLSLPFRGTEDKLIRALNASVKSVCLSKDKPNPISVKNKPN